MPQYRTEIVFTTNDPQEQGELIEIHNRVKNGMNIPNTTVLVQGNKYTISFERYDVAADSEEAEFEVILDIYQFILETINPAEDVDDPLDNRYWQVRDIDVRLYLTDVSTEAV